MSDRGDPIGPSVIGRYRIDGELGRGAMGTVFLGHDDTIDRDVAIKTINRELLDGSDGAEWVARFRHEVRAAGRCVHPNIVTVFDYGEVEGAPYIVMELIEGRTLRDWLRDGRPMSPANSVAVVLQVLDALGHAHAHGVVHRDIKPANIVVLPTGQVKVTDFGIARLDAVDTMSGGRFAVGTPAYMAPEQFTGGEVDRRADLYSTGVVLFELLTGDRPFHRRGDRDLRHEVTHATAPRASERNPALPPELDAVLERALSKAPGRRFQEAGELIDALVALRLMERELGAVDLDVRTGRLLSRVGPAPTPTTQWDEAVLVQTERWLVELLGPVARVLVRRTAHRAHSIAELAHALAAALQDDAERRQFEERMQTLAEHTPLLASPAGPTTGARPTRPHGAFDPALLEAARHDLARYLGPIAKVLVKQAATTARTPRELYARLADHLATAEDRATFLARSPTD